MFQGAYASTDNAILTPQRQLCIPLANTLSHDKVPTDKDTRPIVLGQRSESIASVTVRPNLNEFALTINVTTRKFIHSDTANDCLRTNWNIHIRDSDVHTHEKINAVIPTKYRDYRFPCCLPQK